MARNILAKRGEARHYFHKYSHNSHISAAPILHHTGSDFAILFQIAAGWISWTCKIPYGEGPWSQVGPVRAESLPGLTRRLDPGEGPRRDVSRKPAGSTGGAGRVAAGLRGPSRGSAGDEHQWHVGRIVRGSRVAAVEVGCAVP